MTENSNNRTNSNSILIRDLIPGIGLLIGFIGMGYVNKSDFSDMKAEIAAIKVKVDILFDARLNAIDEAKRQQILDIVETRIRDVSGTEGK